MTDEKVRRKLIKLLQAAHAGERAAAFAYRGHAKILGDKDEVALIKQIEADEWKHRAEIGKILLELNAKPAPLREVLMFTIGKAISFSCHFCRRYWATYFAGRLENGNVLEYRQAAQYAEMLGLQNYAECFREMEQTEFQHEQILQKMVTKHWLLPISATIFRWGKSE